MKFKYFIVCFFICCSLLSACNGTEIIKEEAIEVVKVRYENDNFGKIKIVSVTQKNGKYVVKWERKSNYESGTDYVNSISGKITKSEHSIQ
ncbi:hypothetical protein [Bacillus sp. AFS053548]|uniref:hypothetical protein n=1 Tax=Bacillus sp. AFS053548 TaxID=2033505 RepID=UPI000BFDB1B4|nr:hypothetical protein [Bacillus sp. AFS053548]PGM49022.1 hypothetical protein CN946_22720 [Bacillus sp. AFS053548]